MKLEELQVEEIEDLETVLGMFDMFYGEGNPVFCDMDSCKKWHFFS